MILTRGLLAIGFVAGTVGAARGGVDIKVPNRTLVAKGAPFSLVVSAAGDVLVSSELKSSSWQVDIIGQKDVDVGNVAGAGTAHIVVSDGSSSVSIQLLIVPAGDQFEVFASRSRSDEARTQDELQRAAKTLRKYTDAMSLDVVRAAAKRALEQWLPTNAPKLGGTAVVCLVTVADPAAAPFCGDGAFDAARSFGVQWLQAAADELHAAGQLTKEEAAEIKQWISVADNIDTLRRLDRKKLASAFDALEIVVNTKVTNEKVKVVLKSALSLGKKYAVIYEITKVPPKP